MASRTRQYLILIGVVLMGIWRLAGHREFFGRRAEAAQPAPEEAHPALVGEEPLPAPAAA